MENRYLDNEEKSIMQIWEEVDLTGLSDDAINKKRLEDAAKKHIEKSETKMNIRISVAELQRIKERAEAEGLKYQTFIKSVLHKYLTGQLVDRGAPSKTQADATA